MKVLITSDDNSKVIQYGGKHVHRSYLKRHCQTTGGQEVDYLYPDGAIKLSEKIGTALKNPFGALRYVIMELWTTLCIGRSRI